jgi:hypothetical protein
MNMDFFSIGMADTTKCKAALLPLNTPENKRDVPCEGCLNSPVCETELLECVAARRWYASGDFEDKDVGRLTRKIKSFV